MKFIVLVRRDEDHPAADLTSPRRGWTQVLDGTYDRAEAAIARAHDEQQSTPEAIERAEAPRFLVCDEYGRVLYRPHAYVCDSLDGVRARLDGRMIFYREQYGRFSWIVPPFPRVDLLPGPKAVARLEYEEGRMLLDLFDLREIAAAQDLVWHFSLPNGY